MEPTYDGGRSLDDRPLAAYGGSGMELSADDESRIELAASADELAPDAPPVDDGLDPLATADSLDLADEPGPSPAVVAGAALATAGTRAVTLLRTSRLAAGAAFGGVILVGLLLLAGGGPKPDAVGAQASFAVPPAAVATQTPGNATLVVTGKVNTTLAFGAMTGAGAPSGPLAATWTDSGPEKLALEGPPDRGTRSTDETLVLRFTVTVKEKAVTFTSDAGECTIGMAMHPTNVSGSFTCRNLKSDDGKLVVAATGTYRT